LSYGINEIFAFLNTFGYPGVLLISFVGSIVIFVPIPYFPILIAAAFNQHLDPNLISLSGAVGTTAAKIIIFYASYYESDILKFRKKRSILPLERLLSRYAWVGAFTAALIPIPDFVSVPLGITKYSAWKFATAIFTGKFIFNEALVWVAILLGRTFIKHLGLLGPGTINITTANSIYLVIGIAAGVAIMAVIIYLSLRIDWAKIIGEWFPWTVEEGDDFKRT
jgi:membrane protein YqaA with SNARE-associated domain